MKKLHLFLLGLAGLTAACATSPPPRGSHHENWRGQPDIESSAPHPRALFISPMGEPFRSSDPIATPPMNLWFQAADANGDGQMSQQEYMAEAMRFFDRLDTNHDDVVSSYDSTELWLREAPEILSAAVEPPVMSGAPQAGQGEANENNRRRQRNDSSANPEDRRHHRYGRAEGGGRRGAAPYGLLGDVEPVMSCDFDFDGRVTRQEYQTCAAQRFAILDSNADGTLTMEEARAHRGGS